MSWTRQRRIRLLGLAALGGFAAGALTVSFLFWRFGRVSSPTVNQQPASGSSSIIARPGRLDDAGPGVIQGTPARRAPTPSLQGSSKIENAVGPPVQAPLEPPKLEVDPIGELHSRKLLLPIQGAKIEPLKGMFQEVRGTRMHEAVDILAPRNTPVLAVEGGKIARLFFSQAGGITIYQFDPEEKYTYYYAHLEGYADKLREGDRVRSGEVIGYVGTSGNAPKDTPHLHFAIFKLTEKKHWWEGTPVDPYEVFK